MLAKEGLRFKKGYIPSATCSPSRFSLLTGIHSFRKNINILGPSAPLSIPTTILTLQKLFKKAEYSTAIIGKWHLGLGEGEIDWNAAVKPGPLEIGFDYAFILPSTNDRVPTVYLENHPVINLDFSDPLYVSGSNTFPKAKGSTIYPDGKKDRGAMNYYQSSHGHSSSVINGIGRIGYMQGVHSAIWDDESMADVLVDQAKKFIKENKDIPFFMFFSSQDIHVPRTPHPRFHGKSSLGYRGDAMVQLDWSVGQTIDSLQEHGISDNSIIIFSSDNRPVYDDGTTVKKFTSEIDRWHDASGIYSGGKYQIYEGGTRVPFIVRWSNKIKPGVSNALVNQIDLIASMASILEIELAEEDAPDSRNIFSAFLGHDSIGLPFTITQAGGLSIRDEKWKYIRESKGKNGRVRNKLALYNLIDDPKEKENLAVDYPEQVKRMENMLKQLINSNGVRNFVQ